MAEMIVDGEMIIVDDRHFEILNCFKWHISPKGYIFATAYPPVGTYIPEGQTINSMRKTVYMKQLIDALGMCKNT